MSAYIIYPVSLQSRAIIALLVFLAFACETMRFFATAGASVFPGHNSSFSYHLLLCTFICCMRGK